ncbi:methylamine utilization protein [Alteromonas sp. ASW11-36]|uniref:Methylamine utilization protein n=1 Tax=Alteromonas arenosi TaxID=3055817 RepID=A0ABT7SYE5_9ALTE|nr:methylamine utilization protein [Alteromonas sp. ASW11-36]MDM7860549.1 methylamine utilization protein [Alteromonas sp. ASW11-36]
MLIRMKYAFASTLLMLCASFASLAEYEIKVIDQHGQPVPNAVVAHRAYAVVPATDKIAVVDQIDKRFVPTVVAIQQGDKVRFPNSDNIRHHVYSFSPIKVFEIKLYSGSDVAPIQFEQAGIGVLGCNIHDTMVAYVYVSDGETMAVTNVDGIARFAQPLPDSVTVWHAQMSIDNLAKETFAVQQDTALQQLQVTLIEAQSKEQKRTFGSRTFGKG